MASELKFDELNRLDYRKYFGEMFITPDQMRKRIALAKDIEDVMLFLFTYWAIAVEAEIPKEEVVDDTISKLTAAVEKHIKIDPYVEKHIDKAVNEIVDVTEDRTRRRRKEDEELNELEDVNSLEEDELNRLNGYDWEEDEDSEEDEQFYWLSDKRATMISANEANAFWNYREYVEAKESGKTKKIWQTKLDERVRLTHALVEGKAVDIDGLFLVGKSLMRFPKDETYNPDPHETIHCRCSCKYE